MASWCWLQWCWMHTTDVVKDKNSEEVVLSSWFCLNFIKNNKNRWDVQIAPIAGPAQRPRRSQGDHRPGPFQAAHLTTFFGKKTYGMLFFVPMDQGWTHFCSFDCLKYLDSMQQRFFFFFYGPLNSFQFISELQQLDLPQTFFEASQELAPILPLATFHDMDVAGPFRFVFCAAWWQ